MGEQAKMAARILAALFAVASAQAQARTCPDVSAKVEQASKPVALHPAPICKGGGCTAICEGGKVQPEAFKKALAKAHAPFEMVDPGCALLTALPKLDPACTPDKGHDPGRALQKCGILFTKEREVVPGAVAGLAKAAQLAKQAGMVLVVGSTYRSHALQASFTCREINNGHASDSDPPCGGHTRRACPGGSPHSSGYAVDLHLSPASDVHKSLTPATGEKEKCAVNIRYLHGGGTKTVHGHKYEAKHQRALVDLMYEAGWSWFCGELWHFEYTDKPAGDDRVNSLEAEKALLEGGKPAQHHQKAGKKHH